jgi:hypothetical protein
MSKRIAPSAPQSLEFRGTELERGIHQESILLTVIGVDLLVLVMVLILVLILILILLLVLLLIVLLILVFVRAVIPDVTRGFAVLAIL